MLSTLLGRLPENNAIERIWILAKTDFKLRYYETSLGLFWALIMPLIRLLIYYLVFSTFFIKNIENYGLYIFCGLLIWLYFQEATKKGINVFRSKRYLWENIRCNKYEVYISSVLSSFMGLVFNFIVYIAMSLFFNIEYNWNVLYFPILILNLVILVFAVSLILSTIHIFVKDVAQVWDVVLLAMFWINPIFYAKAIIFEYFPALMYLNPIAGIIVNVRSVIMYASPPDWNMVLYDYAYALVLLGLSMFFFNRFYHKAAEKI